MYPVLFEIGSFQVRSYSVMLLLAFIVAIVVFRSLLKRRTLIDPSVATDLAFWIIIVVVIGARLAYVLMHWSDFKADPASAFYIWEGGAVYYGGFILAFVFGFIYLKVKKIPILPTLDYLGVVIALGEGIGRIGCFLNGCCFGQPTGVCGVTFPANSFASSVFGSGQSIWPTQLFQSGGGFLLFAALLLVIKFSRLRKGQLFGIFLAAFGALRLGVNFFRYYEDSLNLWTNQAIAIGITVIGIGLILYSGFTQEKVSTAEYIRDMRRQIEEAKQKAKRKAKKKK